MATFISTITFTKRSSKNIKESCKRTKAVKAAAKKMGVKVVEIYWSLGRYVAGVIIFDLLDEDTRKRTKAVKAAAKKMGVKIDDIYWTYGPSDGVIIFDAPDRDTATALMRQFGPNVHTHTVRMYKAAEMEKILKKKSD